MDPEPPPRRRRRTYNRQDPVNEVDLVASFQLEASTGVHDGPAWVAVRNHVHLYAQRTLAKKIRNGTVWASYHRLGGHAADDLRHPADGVDFDTAHDLAADTVLGALPVLAEQLLEARWNPAEGANLRTWTVNLAMLRLPTAWRRWRRNTHQRLPHHSADQNAAPDRPDAIIYDLEVQRHIELLDDDNLATIVRLDAHGLTDDEIGELVGRTRKSVEYQLAKARLKFHHRSDLEARRDHRNGAA